MNENNSGGRGASPPGIGVTVPITNGGGESKLLRNSDSQPSYHKKT